MTTLTDVRHVVRTWFEHGVKIGAKYLCVVEYNGSIEPGYIEHEYEFGQLVDEMHNKGITIHEVYDLKQVDYPMAHQLSMEKPWFTGQQTTPTTNDKEDIQMSNNPLQDSIRRFVSDIPKSFDQLGSIPGIVANFIDFDDVCEIVDVHLVYHPDIENGYHMFLDVDVAQRYVALLNNTEMLVDQIPHVIKRKGVVTDGDVWLLDRETDPKSIEEIAAITDFTINSDLKESRRKEALNKLTDEDLEILGLTR